MKHCGALRIDHVLGLLRLWWIPTGKNATQGAYMYYPVEDMLSILALESHRHQCSVIGEDLGTVPDEIVELLSEAGVHSYKVFSLKHQRKTVDMFHPNTIRSSQWLHCVPTICQLCGASGIVMILKWVKSWGYIPIKISWMIYLLIA